MPLAPGFVLSEAQTLLALSGLAEATVPGALAPAVPPGWIMTFQSPELGPFDNLFQLWQNTAVANQYAVAIRGTVEETGSIIEDLASLMIPASFQVTVQDLTISFQFAAEPATGIKPAGIHLGFALGALSMLLDIENFGANSILMQLANLPEGSEVYITGHSRGAALATLVTSYLHYPNYLTGGRLRTFSYKTYSFAQPKPGNDHYSWDYEQAVVRQGLAYRVTNPLDWVPQTPFTLEFLQDVNTPNPLSTVTGISGTIAGSVATAVHAAVALEEARALGRAINLCQNLPSLVEAKGKPAGLLPGAAPLSILASLNFMPAGAEIALVPNIAYTDPNDEFSQHHVATYQALLTQTFG